MAGRKPLPSNLKSIKGTARKGRENKDEPRPDTHLPSPPEHLSREALVEWGRITEQLYQLGLLTEIDRAALAAYCQTYGRWAQAEADIATEGMTVETTNGNIIQSPLVGIANKALELMHKYLTEFGMTPSSRSRVAAKKADAEQDEWAGFGG